MEKRGPELSPKLAPRFAEVAASVMTEVVQGDHLLVYFHEMIWLGGSNDGYYIPGWIPSSRSCWYIEEELCGKMRIQSLKEPEIRRHGDSTGRRGDKAVSFAMIRTTGLFERFL